MDLSISTFGELEPIITMAGKYGTGLELMHFMRLENFNHRFVNKVKKLTRYTPVRSIHGPFCDLIPASIDPKIRDVVMYRFGQAVKAAKSLKVNKIVFHSGYIPHVYKSEDWVENSIKFWKRFARSLPGSMEIHIENVYEDDFSILSDLIDGINDKRFSLCLDVGHVNVNSSRHWSEWIEKLGTKIGHTHLHNNDGKKDSHNAFDDGTIDMKYLLEVLANTAPQAGLNIEVDQGNIEASIQFLLSES
ncbi:MAG: sugar phosphate isomerase/epimerase [Spirochaetales bacterium]|nr:sugar phosphate isomerase/epimerase [Spirochaetales bacterium]